MADLLTEKVRKFREKEYYQTVTTQYFLLPFRFHTISDYREVLVNEVGDFLLVPKGTAQKIVQRKIGRDDDLYPELIANFFISENRRPELIDLIATRYRSKKAFLEDFTALHIFVVTLRCNHSCHYCQVSRVSEKRDEFDISFHDLEAGIQHCLDHHRHL
jgi:hypothetical protein